MVLARNDRGNKELGFRGVFDGRGYSVNGMKVISARWDEENYGEAYRWTGFISVLSKNGIIKDVAFTNASVQYCSYLASWGEGRIENVYVGYTGNYESSYNSTVNATRDSAPSVTMHNCVISYDTAWTRGYILGKVNDSVNAYRNVYVIGPQTKVISYFSALQNKDGVLNYPLEKDNIAYYSSVGDFLAVRKNELSRWNYFSADDSSVSFGSKGTLLTASAPVTKNYSGNVIISADKTTSDYVIVYEDGNDYALNAATFIAEHLRRASGNIAYSNVGGGRIAEELSGGVYLSVTTEFPSEVNESSAYIVIGKNACENAPVPATGRFIVKTVGNTAFIRADDDVEYITAAIAFLKETIGYRALSDDTVTYQDVGASDLTMPVIDVDYDSAFNVRNTTNAHHLWKNNQLGLNGRGRFPIGPKDADGKVQSFHNTKYWLDYETNKNVHPKWFRNGGSDVCYSAGGKQDASNAEYVAMVALAATNIRDILNANPDVKDVTFSLMDNDETGCTCSNCSKNRTNAAVTFLNDVVAKIQNLDGNNDRRFTIYMLAYYYLINAPTINMSEHLGVIYAPVRNSYEARSIYDSSNDSVRSQIVAWLNKTKNIGFWYYSTLFHNYMMFTDMTGSLLTWFEFTAKTCKANGAEVVWFSVNGQNRERNRSAFEAFKQFAFSRAEVEILEKVTAEGGTDSYNRQIEAYLSELESEFFCFTVNGTEKTFNEGGFYGAPNANKEMYNLYSALKTKYKNISATNDGTTYECLDQLNCNEKGWLSHKNGCGTLGAYVDNKHTKGYWANFGSGEVKRYMLFANNALAAIEAYSGSMKEVYKSHVVAETLTPRFLVCVAGDNGTYRDQMGYTEADIKAMRTQLKADLTALGISYYAEHRFFSELYNIWGV